MGGEKKLQMNRQKAGEDLAPTTFMIALADIPKRPVWRGECTGISQPFVQMRPFGNTLRNGHA